MPANKDQIIDELDQAISVASITERLPLDQVIKAVQWQAWLKELRAFQLGHELPPESVLGNFYYEISNGLLCTKLRTESPRSRIAVPAESRLVFLYGNKNTTDKDIRVLLGFEPPISAPTSFPALDDCFHYGPLAVPPVPTTVGVLLDSQMLPYTRVALQLPIRSSRTSAWIPPGRIGTSDGNSSILPMTYLHVRAVYLRMLEKQDSYPVVPALRRFASEYGSPKTVYPDNASCFVRAYSVIKALYRLGPDAGKEMS